jgi:hypothetical protein
MYFSTCTIIPFYVPTRVEISLCGVVAGHCVLVSRRPLVNKMPSVLSVLFCSHALFCIFYNRWRPKKASQMSLVGEL